MKPSDSQDLPFSAFILALFLGVFSSLAIATGLIVIDAPAWGIYLFAAYISYKEVIVCKCTPPTALRHQRHITSQIQLDLLSTVKIFFCFLLLDSFCSHL